MKKISLPTRSPALSASQRGIGLIELLLSISIIAIIVIGAIALFSSASNANKSQDMTKGYGVLNATVHALYGTASSYYGLVDTQLSQSGSLPSSMVSSTPAASGTALTSPFGYITMPAVTSASQRTFDVVYPASTIPVAVCNKFVPALIGTVKQVKVNNTAITTPALALTNCVAGATGNPLMTSTAITITSD